MKKNGFIVERGDGYEIKKEKHKTMISSITIRQAVGENLTWDQSVILLEQEAKVEVNEPSFFIQVACTKENGCANYTEKEFLVTIFYYAPCKQYIHYLEMAEKINDVLNGRLTVDDRTLQLMDKQYHVIENKLEYKFNVKITEQKEMIKVNEEAVNMELIHKEQGYTKETIELMDTLIIEEAY